MVPVGGHFVTVFPQDNLGESLPVPFHLDNLVRCDLRGEKSRPETSCFGGI